MSLGRHDDLLLERARTLGEEEWIALLARSADAPVIDGMRMPLFPAVEIQRRFVGSAGRDALHEAVQFYRIVKAAKERVSQALTRDSAVLDFGCGWGRMIRFYLRDVDPEHLYGWDVLPEMVELCRSLDLRATFSTNPPEPPTPFPTASFDVIYAYSVFSHLSERLHLAWVREFRRLLRPNGVLVATTQPRRFIDFCADLRRQTEQQTTLWHEALARSFVDVGATKAAYDAGEFVYAATGGGNGLPAERYGEAVVSPSFVRRTWPPYLEVVDFVDDQAALPQAVIIGRRTSA